MNTVYPMQTRMLIENVLRIGKVDDEKINARLLHFFQDSTLQQMLVDVKKQYENIDDLNDELSSAFETKVSLSEATHWASVWTNIWAVTILSTSITMMVRSAV